VMLGSPFRVRPDTEQADGVIVSRLMMDPPRYFSASPEPLRGF
jgi:hypothetical protein